MAVEATIVVQFGEGADSSALVAVELEPSLNVNSDGSEKTTFYPGDQVNFTVHHDTVLRIGSVVSTDGEVVALGYGRFSRGQQISFADEEWQELPHNPYGSAKVEWYGRQPSIERDGRRTRVTGAPGIGEMSYEIEAALYRLYGPNVSLAEDESYPVLIVVTMEDAG